MAASVGGDIEQGENQPQLPFKFQLKCSLKAQDHRNDLSEPQNDKPKGNFKRKQTPLDAPFDQEMWDEMRASEKLPVLDPESVSYEEFFEKYLLKNMPCMFAKDITSTWDSRKNWVTKNSGDNDDNDDLHKLDSSIDFDYLMRIYGSAKISVVNCDDVEYKYGYEGRDYRDMLFSDYVQQFRDNTTGANPRDEKFCLYLKDWHIVRFHKSSLLNENLPYETPIYFKSDWLNESCDAQDGDDFKFCYMGPKNSFTSFHADVYNSYSWSANVFGVKRWYLYPPGKESRFTNPVNHVVSFDWNDPGTPGEDFIEVIQNEGECLFIPSGWHHVVWNLTDCISINHNWFNGANLCYIWGVLRNAFKDVENELDDLRDIPDFFRECQIILRANHGMNYEDFFKILILVKKTRESTTSEPSHAEFDIATIHHVIEEHCLTDPLVKMHFGESITSLLAGNAKEGVDC